MALFSFLRKTVFFSQEEQQRITDAIREAERRTSGEVRVFIESRCRFVDPLDRAAEIFLGLKMDQTDEHNAVLVYVAVKDHQFAVLADGGIHKKVGDVFWNAEVAAMRKHFLQDHVTDAIVEVITDIGEALHTHFPYDRDNDKNELPDEIVFGR
ncbi:TPM domain-containing protein [Pseudoflavitalea sp. G-6-1-2]|uniref:TPM domain-containing protein n=1 Tax=Pseudoflavitalea sp. G-6-1-2 TaxID=2728841 RepID=UPI00146B3EB8|nr:TPM domain-containing protein [Pseudoflavitalea sp. G-6-1-2]NML24016.1 TPM domain-containing protein [Pseudoflavitalea sp. G-6-1-2]